MAKKIGSFILNAEKRFLTFPYKKKKTTLSDINMKIESEVASPEEFKAISNMLLHANEKSIQTIQKYFDKVIAGKEEEISHLRDHNQKLLLQIKKEKDKAQYNQKLEEENQDLQKQLLENIEENNHLKKRKQDLMDHILKLKYDEKTQDEMLRNLKNDKYSL